MQTPASSARVGNVNYTSPSHGDSLLTNAFTFIAPPVIVSVVPSQGPMAGNTIVTITVRLSDPLSQTGDRDG
jgi:hypothetical protein